MSCIEMWENVVFTTYSFMFTVCSDKNDSSTRQFESTQQLLWRWNPIIWESLLKSKDKEEELGFPFPYSVVGTTSCSKFVRKVFSSRPLTFRLSAHTYQTSFKMVYKRTQMYTVSTAKTEPKKPKMTKEEVYLLDELSKQGKTGLFFHANAVLISLLPLWTFSRVLGMDLEQNVVRIAIVTGISAAFVWYACNEFKLFFKRGLRKKVKKTKNVVQALQELPRPKDDKKVGFKNDKVAAALLKTDRSGEGEASGFALFYNNCYFLSLVLLFGHVGFQKLSVENNYTLSTILAAVIVMFIAATMMTRK